jgi:molybdopterin/thiamine biosynthesis adenylyltransferase
MTIWWFNNISRANKERTDLAELAERSDWLMDLSITLGDGNLCAAFVIAHGEKSFPLTITYPVVFPDAPPLVKTQDGKRISGHQYGPSGELCLEYRPDNWSPEITGAMMVESAYRLLCGEHPQDGAEVPEIIDGHSVSIGQDNRNAWGRLILTPEDCRVLADLDVNTIVVANFVENAQNKKMAARLFCLGDKDEPTWHSSSKFIEDGHKTKCYILNSREHSLPNSPTVDELYSVISASDDDNFDNAHIKDRKNFNIVIKHDETWIFHWVFFTKDKDHVISYRTILDVDPVARISPELNTLTEKKIGLVGCGSVGSKIAVQLSRTEVGSILLIDDDIFFEGNIVRNELSITDIGFHKTSALEAKIKSINPKMSIERRQIKLGGQESSATMISAMEQLATCDLVVDATADPSAFTIIASVCEKNNIPVVWGSVFAGGFGGLIGRALPDSDPPPLEARQQITRWCEKQNVDFPHRENGDQPYEARGVDGQPEIATDPEVAIIASHAARFAIDALVRPNDSGFPNSAYAIGFSRSWIFDAPFDTRPIEYTETGNWSSGGAAATAEEFAKFIADLIPSEETSDA